MSTGFSYVANLLCLDLVNTVQRRDGAPLDQLRGFPDLVAWLEGAGAHDAARLRQALRAWDGTAAGADAFRTALALRRAVREAADDLRDGRPVRRAAVEGINAVLARCPVVAAAGRRGGGLTRVERPAGDHPVTLLAPVAGSALTLLVDLDPTRVGYCAAEDCVRYFYDTTKNHARRWCSMESCGNRAKAAAHYRRTRGRTHRARPA